MTSKNTPGPWEIGRLLDTRTTRRMSDFVRRRHEDFERVKVFADFSEKDQGRSRVLIAQAFGESGSANAKLIAAAPELAQALKSLVSVADFVQDKFNVVTMEAQLSAARAALAKAGVS